MLTKNAVEVEQFVQILFFSSKLMEKNMHNNLILKNIKLFISKLSKYAVSFWLFTAAVLGISGAPAWATSNDDKQAKVAATRATYEEVRRDLVRAIKNAPNDAEAKTIFINFLSEYLRSDALGDLADRDLRLSKTLAQVPTALKILNEQWQPTKQELLRALAQGTKALDVMASGFVPECRQELQENGIGGGIIGGIAGAILGAAIPTYVVSLTCKDDTWKCLSIYIYAPIGAVIGGIVGATIGATVIPF